MRKNETAKSEKGILNEPNLVQIEQKQNILPLSSAAKPFLSSSNIKFFSAKTP